MSQNSSTADREIITTRLIDAPRDLVFRMFTEAEHVVKWWGPNGFTNTNHEMNVAPGGVWRFIMHGPDGTDWGNKIVYTEVVRPERLVYVDSFSDEKGALVGPEKYGMAGWPAETLNPGPPTETPHATLPA